ncbi:MAG: hypothetical protein EXR03_08950 [Pseudolabrys sp.]|nr:hypothetical protein [Pseudolabrys sp.]MSP32928.1 hypothetical protein [Pseudolabrys sp.]
MALLGRIIVIIFAVMLASLAVGIAIAMGLLGPEWHGFSGDVGERFVFWGTAFVGASLTGAIGLLPLVILIVIAEAFKIRSLLVHAAAGAVLLLLGFYGSGQSRSYEESIDRPPPISRDAEIAAAAGVVFGLVYWVIAGRWRERA